MISCISFTFKNASNVLKNTLGVEEKRRFTASNIVQDAIIRNLQLLSESTMRISDELQARHPEVEWFKIRGFRNVLVHDYLGVDLERVWNIIENDLPKLNSAVEKLIQ
jgi:uncharacterized protein with HEPN domain